MRVEQIFRGASDASTAKQKLMDGINSGEMIVNYTGHGSLNLWRGSLLTTDDPANMTNQNHLSFFVMMTCLNGYFHDAALESLAESLIKAPRGGAVAVWTSSGMTTPSDQTALNQVLYQLIFSSSGNQATIGDMTMKAKTKISDPDVRRTWILFGDPTTRLR